MATKLDPRDPLAIASGGPQQNVCASDSQHRPQSDDDHDADDSDGTAGGTSRGSAQPTGKTIAAFISLNRNTGQATGGNCCNGVQQYDASQHEIMRTMLSQIPYVSCNSLDIGHKLGFGYCCCSGSRIN